MGFKEKKSIGFSATSTGSRICNRNIVLHYAKMRKAYVHDVFIAHRVKENNLGYFTQSTKTALVLLHAKMRKAENMLIAFVG